MKAVLVILLFVAIGVAIWLITAWFAERSRKKNGIGYRSVKELGSGDPELRLLATRAVRILDKQLNDDLIRAMLPRGMQEQMNELLVDWYGDDDYRHSQ